MDPSEIAILHRTFLGLIPFSDIAPRVFFERLIVLEPELGVLLEIPTGNDFGRLARLFALMTEKLADANQTFRVARFAGARYRALGVRSEHHASIGEALIWTFQHILGDSMGPQEVAAWRKAFAVISEAMAAGEPPSVGFLG